MNKQQLDERIDILAYHAGHENSKQVRQLITDILDQVVPEKGYTPDFLGGNSDWMKGYNQVITTITDKQRELGL